MKQVLLSLCVASALTIYAQGPTLTSSSAPQPGDVFISQPIDVSHFTHGSPGVNQVWDYSAIRDSGTASTTYVVHAAATPYAGMFPGATIATFGTNGTDTAFVYDAVSSSRYTFLGNYYDLVGSINYNPGRTIFEYPLMYGGAYANTVHGSSDNGDTITGVDSFTTDGYGTLKLPYHTFTNVLRVKYVLHTHTDNSSAGYFENIDQTEYAYYIAGYHTSLFDIEYTTNNINGTTISAITAAYAKAATATGVQDIDQAAAFSVYPNPVNGYFTITGAAIAGGIISVADLSGKVLLQETLTSTQQRISLIGAAKGMYIVTVKSEKGTTSSKIIVE